ncbi:NAD-dependent epimerase/dehydratase family protein, partial [Candidatus Parvarchaeota archaeon]|nr:NAD-dependent epimerase/dehydratase family protein [Candidatus Parvarchaeota archaeon]
MILITGGTGRIGRHLLERLASNPSNRIRLFARKKPNFPLPQNVSVFVGDLSNEVDIRAALSGVSEVVHLAGLVAFHLPRQVLETVNVGHTERLAKCAADAHVHAFIHASSITVYGKGVDGLLVDEGTPPCPTNAYGVSKLASERSVLGFSKTMHVCILRLGVVYGEGISVGYG